MMTRKDFQAVADAIAGVNMPEDARRELAHSMADALRATNPWFDRGRFITACTERES